jgi:hypothetical protein
MRAVRTLIAICLTAAVAVALLWWSLAAFGHRDPLFAFLANWIAMSWVAINGPSLRIHLPGGYYAPRPFETSGRIYELLGIRLFKAAVRRGPLAIFSPTLRFPKERTVEGIRWLQAEMRTAEAGHLLVLALVAVPAVALALAGEAAAAGWLILFAIPINIYPIMLQRYNRIKLEELVVRTGSSPGWNGTPK